MLEAAAEQAAACELLVGDLERAEEGGVLSAELTELLLWHELFDRHACLVTGTIMEEGLMLLVMEMIKETSSGALDNNVIRHHAYLMAREMMSVRGSLPAAGCEAGGVDFDTFLGFAVANRHAFEPLLPHRIHPRVDGTQSSYTFAPSFSVQVWLADESGKATADTVLKVRGGRALEAAYGAVLKADDKATWIARCAQAATDTLALMVRGGACLPAVITLGLPGVTPKIDINTVPSSDDTEFASLVEYVVGKLKNPLQEPAASPAGELVRMRLNELLGLVEIPVGWTLREARAQPEKVEEMRASAPAARVDRVLPKSLEYTINPNDVFTVNEICAIRRSDGRPQTPCAQCLACMYADMQLCNMSVPAKVYSCSMSIRACSLAGMQLVLR